MKAVWTVLRLLGILACFLASIESAEPGTVHRLSVVDVDLRFLFVPSPMDSTVKQKFGIATEVFLEKHLSSSTTEIVHLEATIGSQELDNLPSVTDNSIFPMSLGVHIVVEYKSGKGGSTGNMMWRVKNTFKENSQDFIDMLQLMDQEYFSVVQRINLESSIGMNPGGSDEEPERDDYPILSDKTDNDNSKSPFTSSTTIIIIASIVSVGIVLSLSIVVPSTIRALRKKKSQNTSDKTIREESETDISKNSSESSDTMSANPVIDNAMMASRNVQPIFREDQVLTSIRQKNIVLQNNVQSVMSELSESIQGRHQPKMGQDEIQAKTSPKAERSLQTKVVQKKNPATKERQLASMKPTNEKTVRRTSEASPAVRKSQNKTPTKKSDTISSSSSKSSTSGRSSKKQVRTTPLSRRESERSAKDREVPVSKRSSIKKNQVQVSASRTIQKQNSVKKAVVPQSPHQPSKKRELVSTAVPAQQRHPSKEQTKQLTAKRIEIPSPVNKGNISVPAMRKSEGRLPPVRQSLAQVPSTPVQKKRVSAPARTPTRSMHPFEEAALVSRLRNQKKEQEQKEAQLKAQKEKKKKIKVEAPKAVARESPPAKKQDHDQGNVHPYHHPILNRPVWIDNFSMFEDKSFRSVSTITGALSFDEEMGAAPVFIFDDDASKGCSTIDTIQTRMRGKWDDEDADDFGSIAGSLPSPSKFYFG